LLAAQDIKHTEPAILELKALVEDLFTPKEVKKIITKLRIYQRNAGEIIGGGQRAFYNYENKLSNPMSRQQILLAKKLKA
jgi:hypothetical protein